MALLADVGGDREWWVWNPRSRVGHLRVALTAEEARQIPTAPVLMDAGPAGPPRARTTPTPPHRV